MQGALGYTMKTHHELLALAVLLPVREHLLGQSVDVAGVVVVMVHKAQFGHSPGTSRPGVNGIEHAGRGGGGILRVQRQDQNARGAFGLQGIELAGNRRIAVAHGVAHQHRGASFAQPAPQELGLLLGPHGQR